MLVQALGKNLAIIDTLFKKALLESRNSYLMHNIEGKCCRQIQGNENSDFRQTILSTSQPTAVKALNNR